MATIPVYVQPEPSPAPSYGDPLEDTFQGVIVGITGIAPELVRPRWQPEPPDQPDYDQTWAAFGITATNSDRFVWLKQIDEHFQLMERDQQLNVLMSFYGPGAQDALERFADGIQLQQNRWALTDAGIKLIEVGEVRQLPALLKEKWLKRLDIMVTFRRRIRRVFAVDSVLSAGAGLDNEFYITPIIVSPPP